MLKTRDIVYLNIIISRITELSIDNLFIMTKDIVIDTVIVITNDIDVIDIVKSIGIVIVTVNDIVDDIISKNSVKFVIVDCIFIFVDFIVI